MSTNTLKAAVSNASSEMEDISARTPPDPLILYGFYAGLFLASICLAFTIAYISLYSNNTTSFLERHHAEYIGATNERNLQDVLAARTAQTKTLLQSCGIVAGISFGFLGFSLFLLGIRGTTDAQGKILTHEFSFKRLAPGSLIMLAAIALVGVSATHRIELGFDSGKVYTGPALDHENDSERTHDRLTGGDNARP